MSKSRREFLKAAGLAVVTPHAASAVAQENHAVPSGAGSTTQHVSSAAHADKPDYSFFNPAEARFIEAATARLIPADDAGPGAIEAGVPRYIDKQLGGAWGAGERLYRSGPWHEGEPTQGYQLPFTPSELFRTALRGIQADLDSQKKGPFEALAEAQQDDYLKRLQNEKIDLDGVPSNVFFESLWAMTVEGFLGDPVYGGNIDMISWKMIGFPGAHASYYDLVDQHNLKYEGEPVSIGEDARGRMHIHPNIRATVDARGRPRYRAMCLERPDMAKKLQQVDAVLIGVGLVGSILGRELTKAGMSVVGLERGEPRFTVPDFQGPKIHDELRYSVRKALMQDNTKETVTFRNNHSQRALPQRRWESFLPGTGLGGAAVHWNGQTYRFQDTDLRMRTRTTERYGKDFLSSDLFIQDWGVSAEDLEAYYDRFEYLLGVSGKAGNLQGRRIKGGNPFEDPRSRDYPTPPMKEPYGSAIFRKAAADLGYHPYPQPSANMSQPYTNPEGLTLSTCMFCGFCERYGCEHYAKSSPQTVLLPVLLKEKNFELRTQCQVLRINVDDTGKKATGVTYVDAAGREFEQPADLVIVGSFALNNVRMLLLSGIGKPYDPETGKGVVGRSYAYQTTSAVQVFFDQNRNINPFMRSGANGTVISDFVSDNFDHGPLGFVGGAYIGEIMSHGRPIEFHPTPPGTDAWGSNWKKAVIKHYNHTSVLGVHGSSSSCRANYLDLDPTYKDAWGLPLLRMTFDFHENDLKMSAYVTDKAMEIGRAMGGEQVAGGPRKGPYTTTQYQTTHNTGGTVMGDDPATSVVNRYLQSWDVPNVFVIGASNFPQNASYNPTDTVGALAYWAADAIVNQYRKSPGPLVQA